MEENRLKLMAEDYDQKLFNEIYKDTKGLRNKLAKEINPHLFGVDTCDIVSWFDVKFIFVFQKYSKAEIPPGRLKAFIINALQTYKYRILRVSYQEKYKNRAAPIEDVGIFSNTLYEISGVEKEAEFTHLLESIKLKISPEAFEVLDILLNPPLFIIKRMADLDKHDLSKIPPLLIADYLGYDDSEKALKHINQLKQEIKRVLINID